MKANKRHQTLTGVTVVLILVIGNQQSVVLAGGGLVGESLVFDLVELDHFGGCEGGDRIGWDGWRGR
jgi:hypothetical protein